MASTENTQASPPENCSLCRQLSESANELCRSNRRPNAGPDAPAQQRRLPRAQLDKWQHTRLPLHVESSVSAVYGPDSTEADATPLDISLGGVGVQLDRPAQAAYLRRLEIDWHTSDLEDIQATFEPDADLESLYVDADRRGGFQLRSYEEATEDLHLEWQDVQIRLLSGLTVDPYRPSVPLWNLLEPLWKSIASGDRALQSELLEELKENFATDVDRVREEGLGSVLACYSRLGVGQGLDETIDDELAIEQRVILQVIFRVTLGDHLFFGHQVARNDALDKIRCQTGMALISLGLYWHEHRALLFDDPHLDDVQLITGLLHDQRGMRTVHVDFAEDQRQRGNGDKVLARPIMNFRAYADALANLPRTSQLEISGRQYPVSTERWSQLDESEASRGRQERTTKRITATLEQRGALYRSSIGMPKDDLMFVPAPNSLRGDSDDGDRTPPLRDREIFITSIKQEGILIPCVALVCDSVDLFTNVSGILDVARPFLLDRLDFLETEDERRHCISCAVATALADAANWYLQRNRPKRFFTLLDDLSAPLISSDFLRSQLPDEGAVIDEVGRGFHWCITRDLLKAWMRHIASISVRRLLGSSESE